MRLLVPLLLLRVTASGAGVVLSRTPHRQAPDVAFAELAVGTVALPLLFLVVLASVRMERGKRKPADK